MKCQDCGTDSGTAYFICIGDFYEPVPDGHNRIAGYCKDCARKHGIDIYGDYDST